MPLACDFSNLADLGHLAFSAFHLWFGGHLAVMDDYGKRRGLCQATTTWQTREIMARAIARELALLVTLRTKFSSWDDGRPSNSGWLAQRLGSRASLQRRKGLRPLLWLFEFLSTRCLPKTGSSLSVS